MILRAAAAAALLSLAACATATTGVAVQPLDPQRAAASRVNVVRMTSGWVSTREDFGDTFTDALHANLARCATGPAPLDLHIHVERVRRAGRLPAMLHGGNHELAAVAELVDPATRAVVGRYPIQVAVDAGGPVQALLSDRQQMVSDAFARELCRQAFARG